VHADDDAGRQGDAHGVGLDRLDPAEHHLAHPVGGVHHPAQGDDVGQHAADVEEATHRVEHAGDPHTRREHPRQRDVGKDELLRDGGLAAVVRADQGARAEHAQHLALGGRRVRRGPDGADDPRAHSEPHDIADQPVPHARVLVRGVGEVQRRAPRVVHPLEVGAVDARRAPVDLGVGRHARRERPRHVARGDHHHLGEPGDVVEHTLRVDERGVVAGGRRDDHHGLAAAGSLQGGGELAGLVLGGDTPDSRGDA
jgi:hypothetical protein